MIYNTEITIDGAIINIDVYYSYFKDSPQPSIVIDNIKCGSLYVFDLLSEEQIESIESKCETHYENYKFNEIEALMNKTWFGMDNSQTEL